MSDAPTPQELRLLWGLCFARGAAPLPRSRSRIRRRASSIARRTYSSCTARLFTQPRETNLRGFKGELKRRAEDISNGTVTLPIAKAMSLLPAEDRERLWQTLKSRTTDDVVLAHAVELLERCGAITACSD